MLSITSKNKAQVQSRMIAASTSSLEIKNAIPSEKRISSKWEEVSFLFVKYFAYGMAAGALASVVAFRKGLNAPARGKCIKAINKINCLFSRFVVAMSFYGAGFGSGIAFVKGNDIFDSELCKEEEVK